MCRPLALILLAIFGPIACQEKGGFKETEIDAASIQNDNDAIVDVSGLPNDKDIEKDKTNKPEPTPSLPPKTIEEVITSITPGGETFTSATSKCQTLPLQSKKEVWNLPKAPVCEWGKNGNLAQDNGRTTARHEQSMVLSELPENAILCEMKIDSPVATVRYDDEIIFTFNGVVLHTSYGFFKPIVEKVLPMFNNKYYVYDWLSIRNGVYAGYQAKYSEDYCIGNSSCLVPPTDTQGRFQLSFDRTSILQIGLLGGLNFENGIAEENLDPALIAIAAAQKNTLMFITTGDDDGTDCAHDAFDLNVERSYVVP